MMSLETLRSDAAWLWNASRGIRKKAVLNCLIGVSQVALDFTFIAASKAAIDIATGRCSGSLFCAVALLAGSRLLTVGMNYAYNWVTQLLGASSKNQMRLRTFARIMRSAWNGREQFHSGDTMNRLMEDTNQVTRVITDVIPRIASLSVRLLGAVIFMYQMQPLLAVLLIVIAPSFILVSRFWAVRMRTLSKDIRDAESVIQSRLQESLQNRVVIKTLERTEEAVQDLSSSQVFQVEQVRKRTRFSSVTSLIMNIGFSAGYLVTFIWGVCSLRDNLITYGMMMAFVQLVAQIQGPISSLASMLPELVSTSVSVERLRELENVPEEETGREMLSGAVGVRFNSVSFTYADGDAPVLSEFGFDFKPGTVTAVLGETGAGKTTLVRLILSLLRPTAGKVEFYSERRTVEASARTRCNLVYVPQGNTLLSGTVRENLLLGNPAATDIQMAEVLRLCCADFVLKNPHGLDWACGEDGEGLSEGQAQRISIARSLLRDGKVLVLDEATSALDPLTENKFMENLAAWAADKGLTVIFVTHRDAVSQVCTDVCRL